MQKKEKEIKSRFVMPLLCRKGKNNKKKIIEVLKVSCDSF